MLMVARLLLFAATALTAACTVLYWPLPSAATVRVVAASEDSAVTPTMAAVPPTTAASAADHFIILGKTISSGIRAGTGARSVAVARAATRTRLAPGRCRSR